jgi:hypothetical protein
VEEVVGFGALPRNFPGNDEEKHVKPESVRATSGSSFKPRNARIPSSGATKYSYNVRSS